jgi:hypothetical protein
LRQSQSGSAHEAQKLELPAVRAFPHLKRYTLTSGFRPFKVRIGAGFQPPCIWKGEGGGGWWLVWSCAQWAADTPCVVFARAQRGKAQLADPLPSVPFLRFAGGGCKTGRRPVLRAAQRRQQRGPGITPGWFPPWLHQPFSASQQAAAKQGATGRPEADPQRAQRGSIRHQLSRHAVICHPQLSIQWSQDGCAADADALLAQMPQLCRLEINGLDDCEDGFAELPGLRFLTALALTDLGLKRLPEGLELSGNPAQRVLVQLSSSACSPGAAAAVQGRSAHHTLRPARSLWWGCRCDVGPAI